MESASIANQLTAMIHIIMYNDSCIDEITGVLRLYILCITVLYIKSVITHAVDANKMLKVFYRELSLCCGVCVLCSEGAGDLRVTRCTRDRQPIKCSKGITAGH